MCRALESTVDSELALPMSCAPAALQVCQHFSLDIFWAEIFHIHSVLTLAATNSACKALLPARRIRLSFGKRRRAGSSHRAAPRCVSESRCAVARAWQLSLNSNILFEDMQRFQTTTRRKSTSRALL
eukprot:6205376-Pleurochrysis_carterae.AAC.5